MNREELRNKVRQLPKSSGVYIMKDDQGEIIYVGKAKNLPSRVKSYFDDSPKTHKTYSLVSNIFDFDYILTDSELDAFNLESNLIKRYKPKYNILLKDDKSFPYIAIDTREKYPRVQVVRRPKKKAGVLLFGPYVTGTRISTLLDIIKSAFKVRTCNINFNKQNKQLRPCLHGELGNCLAPCMGGKDQEYQGVMSDIVDFLNGKTSKIKQSLKARMDAYSNELKFEEAMDIRDKIDAIEKMESNLITSFSPSTNIDVFGSYLRDDFVLTINVVMVRNGKNIGQQNYRVDNNNEISENVFSSFIAQYYEDKYIPSEIIIENEDSAKLIEKFLQERSDKKVKVIIPKIGVKKQLVANAIKNAKEYAENSNEKQERHERLTIGAQTELAQLLGLDKINRIEGFDISNISGNNNVASMVVFTNGEADKKEYRRFKIQGVVGPNDFACMKETLERRARKLLEGDPAFPRPDLIMIDGGLGQLHKAKEALDSLGVSIPLVSLAERDEEIYTLNSNKPIRLPKTNYALRLLIRVRDEAHRFAVSYYQKLHGKSLKSSLLDVEGLGVSRVKMLYEKFKTIENIMNAKVEDIASISGIGEKTAIKIYNNLHS